MHVAMHNLGPNGMERIRLNVGGQKHETYLSTVGNLPDTRLYAIVESAVKSPDYDPETTEVFFDRHPAVFAQVLNYYRTGKLHCPTDVCGPLFEQELEYWGIDEKDMEPCCWASYTQHRDAEANLKNVLYDCASEEYVADQSYVSHESEVVRVWKKIQPKVWAILDESRSSSRARVFSFASVLFIVVSVAMFCVNTIPEVSRSKTWRSCFGVIDIICGIWFTFEFLLRVIFCPNKRLFLKSWSTWIDFLAIAPFYLKFITHENAINALLVIRLLRLFRFFRLIYGLQVLSHTLKASSYELLLLLSMLLIPVILFSSIVFFIEDHFDRQNTKFRSIPHSFWWSLITITTVGYGDMHPVTWLGKVVGSMCAICGVLIVALPVSIIGSNFSLFYTHAQARLKLPKKKNRLFIQQTSTVYSEKHLARRKAIRRKVSSRTSDAYSVIMCGDSRASSIQGTLMSNGAKRTSVVATKDENRLFPGKKTPKKKLSTISIKLPKLETSRVDGQEEKRDRERGYASFDSTHYVTKKRSVTTPPGAVNDDNVESGRCLNNDDVKTNNVQSAPELIPLLVEPCLPRVRLNDVDAISGGDCEHGDIADGTSLAMNHHDFNRLSVHGDELANNGSDSENYAGDLCDVHNSVEENVSPTRQRKMAVVDWKSGRPSSLRNIFETAISDADDLKDLNTSSIETKNENVLSVPEITMLPVHFNRGRRQPIF